MKLPRVRFTIGMLMVVVVAVAIIFGAVATVRRRGEEFRAASASHARLAQSAANTGWGLQRLGINPDGSVPGENARQAASQWRLYAHHKSLGEKYGRADRSPWLPVDPDLPPPK